MNKKILVSALKRVMCAIPKKTQIPALKNVRITLSGYYISVFATDLKHTLTLTVKDPNCFYGHRQIALVDAQTLKTALDLCGSVIHLTTDCESLVIMSGSDTHPIPKQPIDEYPIFEDIPSRAKIVECGFSDLIRAIGFGSVCAATDAEAVIGFAGCRLRISHKRIEVASQDRFRLSESVICESVWLSDTAPKQTDIFMPSAVVSQLLALNDPNSQLLTISSWDNCYEITDHDTFCVRWYRPTEQGFIDYYDYFDDLGQKPTATLFLDELVTTLRDVLKIAKKSPDDRVSIVFDPDKREMIFSSKSAGGLSIKRDVVAYGDRGFSVDVNCSYLSQIVNAIPKPDSNVWRTEVRLIGSGSAQPLYILPSGTYERAVVMYLS
jgi:DNA polymerase III sliding clamp (beta) subunit (PCNA family)